MLQKRFKNIGKIFNTNPEGNTWKCLYDTLAGLQFLTHVYSNWLFHYIFATGQICSGVCYRHMSGSKSKRRKTCALSVAFSLTSVTCRLSCTRAFSRGEDDHVNYSGVRGG